MCGVLPLQQIQLFSTELWVPIAGVVFKLETFFCAPSSTIYPMSVCSLFAVFFVSWSLHPLRERYCSIRQDRTRSGHTQGCAHQYCNGAHQYCNGAHQYCNGASTSHSIPNEQTMQWTINQTDRYSFHYCTVQDVQFVSSQKHCLPLITFVCLPNIIGMKMERVQEKPAHSDWLIFPRFHIQCYWAHYYRKLVATATVLFPSFFRPFSGN